MSRLALGLALTICTAGPLIAECSGASLFDRLDADQSAALARAARAYPYGEGIGWQAVRGDDHLTLIGTMHLPDPRHDALVDRFLPYIAESELLLVEATSAEEAALQEAMLANPDLMFNRDGPTLPELLDDETWAALSDAMRDRGIPPAIGSKMRPWFLMLSLGIPPCAIGALTGGEPGLDKALMAEAAAAGIPVAALEPWDTLFRLITTVSEDDQIEMLKMGLMDDALQQELYVAMLDGYFAGRIAEVWELGRIAMDFVPGLDPAEADAAFQLTEDAFLTHRNRAWVDEIDRVLADHDRITIAAGAAHLPGEVGLLNLLAAEGWTISPLD